MIPRASGMHASKQAGRQAAMPSAPIVSQYPQYLFPYGSRHRAARRAPPSMKLAVGTAGSEPPPLPLSLAAT